MKLRTTYLLMRRNHVCSYSFDQGPEGLVGDRPAKVKVAPTAAGCVAGTPLVSSKCLKNLTVACFKQLNASTFKTVHWVEAILLREQVYAVRAIERVPAGSCHFSCLTDPSQSVVSFPCVWK